MPGGSRAFLPPFSPVGINMILNTHMNALLSAHACWQGVDATQFIKVNQKLDRWRSPVIALHCVEGQKGAVPALCSRVVYVTELRYCIESSW